VEEGVANLKEATELYLEEFAVDDGKWPVITTFEVAEISRGSPVAAKTLCKRFLGKRVTTCPCGRSPLIVEYYTDSVAIEA